MLSQVIAGGRRARLPLSSSFAAKALRLVASEAAAVAKTSPAAVSPSDTSSSRYHPTHFLSAVEQYMDDFEPRWSRALMPRWAPTVGKPSSWRPTCDVRETDKDYIIQAEVPGAKKQDIKLELDGNELRIHGEVKEAHTNTTTSFYHRERDYGYMSRTFEMPKNADMDHVKAEHADGVLTVLIPKLSDKEPGKRNVPVH